MTSYALTLHFDAEPESMRTFDMTGEPAAIYFKNVKKELRQKGVKITKLIVAVLDENGNPRVLPECEEVVRLRVHRAN